MDRRTTLRRLLGALSILITILAAVMGLAIRAAGAGTTSGLTVVIVLALAALLADVLFVYLI